jgi:truncated hemoglobin YjbI
MDVKMDAWVVAAFGLALLAGCAGYLWWDARQPPTEELVVVEPHPVDRLAGLPRDYVLVPPPRIGRDTLRDWLIHRHREDGIWAKVVATFYTVAADDDEIFAYFKHLDEAGMERLQTHFCRQLCILTHTGLTVRALKAMEKRHANLGITGPVFDRTILALVGVLDGVGVPDSAVQKLQPAVKELRAVIVTA